MLKARIPLPPKQADGFYTSPEWRKLIASIKAERGERCEDTGPHSGRLMGDHIIEVKDGGAKLDRRNIMLRCAGCHNRKTARVKRERML